MSCQPPTTIPFTIDNVIPGMAAFPSCPDLYRILIHPDHAAAAGGATVKYLTAPNTSRTLTGTGSHFLRHTRLAFDRLPTGNWVVGHLAEQDAKPDTPNPNKSTGTPAKLHLLRTIPAAETTSALNSLGLRSALPLWCGTTIPEITCRDAPSTNHWTTIINPATGLEVSVPKPKDLQCMDYLNATLIPAPAGVGGGGGTGEMVVYVREWLPAHWQGIENEMRVMKLVQEREGGLAPRVLAHVVENGERVIGFLLERVVGVREAGIGDLEACKDALRRLHALGFTKGKLSRHVFLLREDGTVMMQGDFGYPLDDPADLARVMTAEMESLEEVLSESPSKFEDQAAGILRLIDPERQRILDAFDKAHGVVLPIVFWQESREGGGRITLTVEQHGELVQEYKANGYRWTKELRERAQERFGPAKGVSALS